MITGTVYVGTNGQLIYPITGSTATTGTYYVGNNGAGATSTATTIPQFVPIPQITDRVVPYVPDDIDIPDGRARTIRMPDGAVIHVDKDGSYRIDDANATVVYRACRVHDFNSFLNASDKVEAFIQFCGEVGVRQGDVLGIPIKHFIQWLVIEAAKADGELPPPLLPDLTKPRCITCGRFMRRALKAQRIEFCRVECFARRLESIDGRGQERERPAVCVGALPGKLERAEA